MKVYYENLYSEIIEKSFDQYEILDVISGYASPSFLLRIINEFSNKKINLYIGMTHQGLSYKDFFAFLNLCSKYSKVNVFYQIKGTPTHMKVLEFSNTSGRKTFLGSANFSEAGFMNHREVMVQVQYGIQEKVKEQNVLSLHCSDVNVLNYITLLHEELNHEDGKLEGTRDEIVDSKNRFIEIHECVKLFNQKYNIDLNSVYNGNLTYLSLPIILNNENNGSWRGLGVNNQTGRYVNNSNLQRKKMVEFFKRNHFFKVKTLHNKKTNAELRGSFGKELYFHDFDLNEYIHLLIGIPKKEIITNDNLKEFGFDSLLFKKVNDKEFLMTLHNSSEV
ncbi:phospholipase D family protein [Staphylococcus xylosus]|uniref:phospholipase D family protein n=1 Tax=Staphylococcus xylosus TaxID=1288 RepID=UPI0011A576AF|nr:phospholipase D family protein [Staphylococcus xylosus]MCE7785400.1 phospholipase D family protein [Staphylococcus xylosus]MCM3518782.1 phospholipase D family protein [Staphylococcus xylosus]